MVTSLFRTLADRPVMTAVLGAMSIAFSGILVRLAHVEPATAAIFRCAYALPALGLIAYLERRRHGPRPAAQVRLAMLAGIFLALDLVIWHHTITLVGAGLATVLGNTQVVIVAILAWLILGERPPRRTLLALPVVLVGVVLISGVVGSDPYGSNPGLGVILGIRRPAGPLFDATLIGALASLVIGLPLGEVNLVPTWPAHAWLLTLALTSQVIGWLIISVSLPRLPAALTSVILTLQPVGSVLLAMLLLGESPSAIQLLGAGTILVGLVLATLRLRGEPRRRAVAEPEIG